MNESITQSLAGRVGILTLLPLSLRELKAHDFLDDIDKTLLQGSYPSLYERKMAAGDLYPSYIHTYLERDLRQIANVGEILTFQKLMRLCALLAIKSVQTLRISPYRGHLFESLILSDLQKQYYNQGLGSPSTYFWRDSNGRLEVDCLIDRGDKLFPMEIKSAETLSPALFASLVEWNKMAKENSGPATLVYGGDKGQNRTEVRVLGWRDCADWISKLHT